MDWCEYIESDPKLLGGKPVVRGTHLAVDFVLGLLADGWTEREVLENYPTRTPEGLRAVFAYAAEALRDEALHPFEAGRLTSARVQEDRVRRAPDDW